MKPLKLAIVGCGIAARDLHWPALRQLKRQFEIRALCSRTMKSADALGELVGCNDRSTDYAGILRREDIDAVDLVLPIPLNHDFARNAIRAGKHVLVEKPLAANLRDALALARLARKSPHVVAMVAENIRHRPTLIRLKAMIDRGDIGDAYFSRFDVFISVTHETNKYMKTQWRLNHEYPAGFPVDGGIHNVNAMRFLFGELELARSYAQQINPRIGDIDTLRIDYMAKDSRIPVQLNLCYSARGKRDVCLLVFGTKGTLEMRGNTLTLFRDLKPPRIMEVRDSGGYVEEFRAFHDAIRKGKPNLTDFDEGARDLKTILDAVGNAERITP
ncbi:Gfo/Idh/MocA family oxidoreductase [Candidatus Sumerlaeota bacterium]|nr:Gfo/Idh/MocA family oxidoreductase [Candidatus Sumerlaeota bacterium]